MPSETIQVFTAMMSVGAVIFSGIGVCILISMSQQANARGDKAAAKAEEVREDLKVSNDVLAKETTLQELKDKQPHL